MLIKLDKHQIDNVVKLEDKNYGTELAIVKPAKSSMELDKSLKVIKQAQNIGTTLNKLSNLSFNNNSSLTRKNAIKNRTIVTRL